MPHEFPETTLPSWAMQRLNPQHPAEFGGSGPSLLRWRSHRCLPPSKAPSHQQPCRTSRAHSMPASYTSGSPMPISSPGDFSPPHLTVRVVAANTACAQVSTALLPLYGQIADIFGRHWLTISTVAIIALGSGISGGARSAGMLIGGAIAQHDWRWAFWINLPISAVSLTAGAVPASELRPRVVCRISSAPDRLYGERDTDCFRDRDSDSSFLRCN